MKQIIVQISDEAHEVLLRLQFERKMAKEKRTALKDVASDTLEEYLLKKK